jgi:hypothetical protein
MHPNEQLLTQFYSAFARQDAGPMRAAYADNAHFSDPAFPDLHGQQVGDMWAMLCEQAKDFRLEFRDVKADDTTGSVHWEAHYLFRGRRPVHNIIEARFTFAQGKIVRHIDTFDFWRWSRQAVGPLGLLLGWTPWLRHTVAKTASKSLATWQKAQRS